MKLNNIVRIGLKVILEIVNKKVNFNINIIYINNKFDSRLKEDQVVQF